MFQPPCLILYEVKVPLKLIDSIDRFGTNKVLLFSLTIVSRNIDAFIQKRLHLHINQGRDTGAGRQSSAYEDITSCPEQYGLQTYAHPTNCDQFYKCANGTLTLETCENGLLFDGAGSVHNFCNYHWATNCGERVYECINSFCFFFCFLKSWIWIAVFFI